MFDKLKALGAISSLMRNGDAIREAGQRVSEELARRRLVGQAGGGAVRATVSGQLKVLEVELTPALVAGLAGDDRMRQMAGDLIAQAVNDALQQARDLATTLIESEAKAAGLGGPAAGLRGVLP